MNRYNSYPEMRQTMANDGTSCGYDGNSYCIQGACRFVGCDGKLNGAKLDNCGVCNGDGSSRHRKEQKIIDHRSYNGKLKIKRIPIGSTNIQGDNRHSDLTVYPHLLSKTITKFKLVHFVEIRKYSWVHDQ